MTQPVAFLVFDPAAPFPPLPGSFGVDAITATIPGQAFDVLLAPGGAAGVITLAASEELQIVPTVHEAFAPYTITPLLGGFSIDFGVVLVRRVTIAVSRGTSET